MLLLASQTLETIWSAVAAAVSVILVLLYGYLARRWGFVTQEGENNMSKVSVSIFLPCLLFSEIGPLASWSSIKEYWIIVAYSLVFQVISAVFGYVGVYGLKMPQWVIPCMVFNNVTSLPLLLLSSLGSSGTLSPLIGQDDDLQEIMKRGRVYLLINALICNLTRFTFGPYLMESHPISIPHPWTYAESPHAPIIEKLREALPSASSTSYPIVEPYPPESEPLLATAKQEGLRSWRILKIVKKSIEGFMNPPMIGGILAVIAGILPFLRRALFDEGALLQPFSQSIDNLGSLYTVLQMFVLGAHLRSKKGSRPPIVSLIYLFAYRFVIMPAISTGIVYAVRKGLGDRVLVDPILDFVMILAPVGPPALTLAAIVEMSGADDQTQTAVAQTIVVSYILTPLVSGTVTAALAVVQKMDG